MSNKITPKKSGSLGKGGASGLSNLSFGMSAPSGFVLPRLFNQLVIFLLDGSGSMTFEGETGESKGREVSKEVSEVLTRLLESKNKDCFDVAVYAFANEHKCILEPTALKDINLNGDYNPCNYIDDYGWTKVGKSLQVARQKAQEYVAKHDKPGFPAKSMILVLSDGAIHDISETKREAEQAKMDARIFLASVFFSSDECSSEESAKAQEALRSLASSGGLFSITDTVSDIREHMINSISTLS
jgi:Mg-chelatase subunit ChlD